MIQKRQEIRQADDPFKLETGAIFDCPDNKRFQTTYNR
jgi:hypothetical protein